MEFKEFCKERSRMCDKYLICEDVACKGCPLDYIRSDAEGCLSTCVGNPDEAEKIVSEWAKKHPIVRNVDKFQEVFGDGITQLYKNNVVNDEVDTAIKKWLFKEYQPPRKEETDGQS